MGLPVVKKKGAVLPAGVDARRACSALLAQRKLSLDLSLSTNFSLREAGGLELPRQLLDEHRLTTDLLAGDGELFA